MNGVIIDLAKHPDIDWCVVINDSLLPIRFKSKEEATTHFLQLKNPTKDHKKNGTNSME